MLADRVIVQAGAGIVADSEPAAELAETEHKARGALRAVALARQAPRLLAPPGSPGHISGLRRPSGMADAFKLVSTSGDQTIDVKPATTLVVGRAVNSDVPIYDPTISRQHAQLSIQNGGILVKDLGSSNGTFLNGSRITEAVATPNDVVMFGKGVLLRARGLQAGRRAQGGRGRRAGQLRGPAQGTPGDDRPPAAALARGRHHLRTGPAALARRLGRAGQHPGNQGTPPAAPRSSSCCSRSRKPLSRQQEVDKLLESVVDFTFQVMAVDRVSILLNEPGATEPIPKISKSRLGEGFASARHVPRSIVSQVMTERVAILTDNAAEDERFKGKSILMQSVRSAMGAPLLTSAGVGWASSTSTTSPRPTPSRKTTSTS